MPGVTTERRSRPWCTPAWPCHWAVAVPEPGANVACVQMFCALLSEREVFGSNIFICLWFWKFFLSSRGILHTPAQAQAHSRHAKVFAEQLKSPFLAAQLTGPKRKEHLVTGEFSSVGLRFLFFFNF